MNVTDVGHLTSDADQGEDKMLKSAREQGQSVWQIAEFYTRAFFEDCAALNVLRPTVVCRATEHIQDMIALIRRLESRGFTYQAGGNVYFDIGRFAGYGRLAGQNLEDLKAGARVEVDEGKRHPLDFVLWFTRSKFEHQAMLWDSPWGRGYPGWHIECSAMSMKYLGEQFDIHCGGVDHVPVHHTNEIAQSEAATGRKWVNYWLHAEFLVLAKEKMAKSAGGFLTLDSLRKKGFDPLDYRYLCLGAHYRSQLQFSWEALEAAASGRQGLKERLGRLREEVPGGTAGNPEGGAEPGAERDRVQAFLEEMADDLNSPRALAVLWGLLRDAGLPAAAKVRGALAMDRVLGLGLAAVEAAREEPLDEEARALLEERGRARGARDWARADALRQELARRGIQVEDTPGGVRWKSCNAARRSLFNMLHAGSAHVYDALYPILFRVAYRFCGNRDKAEDICQEAFIKYFQRGEPLPDLEQTKYWLIRVLRNLALNHEKKRSREIKAYQRLARDSRQYAESGEAELLREESRSLVQGALDRLPFKLRSVLVLKEYADLGYREIARILGISEGNVKVRVFRARERLAQLLEGEL
jgi:cysteinyl-tRNA synthetase